MKKASWVFFALCFTTASFAQDTGQNGYGVASRNAHSTLWQQVEWTTDSLGRAVARTNEFVEIATSLNYFDEATQQWQPSREEWEVYPNAIVARAGQHKVILAHNLSLSGAVDVLLPDGATRLISSPVSLGFFDPEDGKQLVIAEVKDCAAERGAAANEIVFRNCFDRIRGSIRFLYTKAGVHQHVVLEQKLELPEGFSDKSRLECYTVFDAATPWPQITTRVLRREMDPVLRAEMVEPDFTDSELTFPGAMTMRAGKAFSLGEEVERRLIRVGKQYQVIDGLPVLIEAVEFRQLEPLLARLASTGGSKGDGLAINSSRQVKRAQKQANRSQEHYRAFENKKEIELANQSLIPPAVVLDYELLSSATNLTLKGDTTYYISGLVNLAGTTVIEGSAVLKYTNWSRADARLNLTGPVVCQTGPYRPAIFTSMDDDSVGTTLPGSTGTPTNHYGYGMSLSTSGSTLTNLRFAYLYEAVSYDSGGSSGDIHIGNAQFVKCRYPLAAEQSMCFLNCGATLHLDNALVTDCDVLFRGDIGILRAQHLTAHRCNWLGDDYGADCAIYLTNSLLVAVSNWGNITCTTNTTVYYATDPGGVFQTVGAGAHYLSSGSAYRNAGTTSLSSNLLATLRQKTTYPPVLISNVTITVSRNLLPQAQRDTDAPDLGFHYDPLDFIVAQCVVTNATLNLSNGVAIGYYNQAAGIWLQDNSAINSVGSPLSPNWFAHYTLVQEQPVYIGNVALSSALAVNPYHYGNTGPDGLYRFTRFASPGGAYLLIHSAEWAYSNLWVQDCQFWNGWNYLEGTTNSAAVLKNNLFERSILGAYATASTSLTLSNNLVRNTEVMLLNQDGANLWRIHDNAFDHCDVSSLWMPLTNSHNAYINCAGRLQPTNVNDVVLTSFNYVTGPLGDYYQSSTNLQNAGSVANAGLAGLYHYTTLTNQTKEAISRLDIGFHYVAVDSSGEPVDTDHGGVPDYLEDANGNGTVNTGETDWTTGHAPDDDLAGVYGSVLVPRYLRCEYRQNPLGVETNYGPPRLYWIVTSNRRAQKQSAYRLLVASSEANLNLNYGDTWDSHEVPSDQTLHVEYKGSALSSGQPLWWKVRSWDAWGTPSPWSTNAYFQMGLLSTNDWTAQWLTTATDPGDNVSPMYRRAFVQLTNEIKRATAYVSAKGVYELWIDGQRIGPNILAPEWTDYNVRFQYQTYDVTTNLMSANTDGTNHVIGAIVGEGWFHGSINHDAAGSYYYTNYTSGHGPNQLLLQLRIDRNDGSSNIVTSGSNWACNTNGPIRYASIEHGETYDATRLSSVSNWSTFKYTGEGAVFTAPVATESLIVTQMFAQPTDPIQIIGYVQPIDMWTNRYAGPFGNRFVRVFDMGRVIEGWCILSFTNTIEPTGTNIYLRHANSLQLDSNNRQVRGTNISLVSLCGDWASPGYKAEQKETYVILQTNILQQFQPHFTYHSFRFIEVDAPERIPLNLNSLVGCVIRSSMPITGAFDCSHRGINQLMTNMLWTLEANVYGLPTAAADRNERYGWFADTDVSAQTSAFLLDMAALWTKSIRDIRDGQYKHTFAPLTGSPQYVYYGAYNINNPLVPNSGVGDVGLESGGIVRPWRLYQNYGDARMLREHYLSSSNWLYYLATNWVANKLSHWVADVDILNMDDFNHFNPVPHDPPWPTTHATMHSAIHGLWAYIHSADVGASMSSILQAQALAAGDTTAAGIYGSNYVTYSNMAADGRSYFMNSVNGLVAYDSQTGGIKSIGNKTQGDYACALYFNMVPENQRSNCVYLLVNEPNKGILDYNKNWLSSCINHLSTGTFATGPAMHELTRNGYNWKAYELLTDYSFPSWLYQITNGGPAYTGIIGTNYGATTCWERWNGWVSGSSHGGYASRGEGDWSSFNQLWNASVGEWVWRNVAGINPDETSPGFKNVIVYPRPGGGITNSSATLNSICGTIRSSWTNAGSSYTLSVTVPPNATASVFLVGATNLASITESGLAATNAVGLLSTPVVTNGAALFQIGSGSYLFNASF